LLFDFLIWSNGIYRIQIIIVLNSNHYLMADISFVCFLIS